MLNFRPMITGFALLFFPVTVLLSTPLQVDAKQLPYRNNSERWHEPGSIRETLIEAVDGSRRAKIHTLGKSPAAFDLLLLELAPQGIRAGKPTTGPAILVVGNPLGNTPSGTEGALNLVSHILSDEARPATGDVRWYILPCANPDAAAGFFNTPLLDGGRNATPVDDDKDGAFGEDKNEDINGDGLISQMLLADPEGTWLFTDESRILARKANSNQNETGLYRLLSEGFDNDEDGLWNEDGVGGVICGHNFPHRFEHWTTTDGLWPGDQPESRAILDFAFSHPDIAMILVLDGYDTLLNVPGKITKDTNMDEEPPHHDSNGKPRTEAHPGDLPWWHQISDEYQQAVFDTMPPMKSADVAGIGPGSLSEWAYFQFGVPTFAISFWNLPAPAETAADSSILTEPTVKADPIAEALLDFQASGQYNTVNGNWPGYLPWTAAKLPDGRQVFVGGEAPFCRTTPPSALLDSLLALRIPFLASLPERLPMLELQNISLDHRGSGVFELTAWISNSGFLDYPTAQGSLCLRVPPVIVTLNGGKILEGRSRVKVEKLPAHQSVPVRWLIQAKPGTKLEISAEAPSLGRRSNSITVSTKGGQR